MRDILLMVIAFNFTNVIVAWPVGALSDRVGRRGLIAVAWSIYAVTYLGLAIAAPGFPIVVLWALYGVYYGVSDAVGKALVADVVPPAQRATGYGILNMVTGLVLLPASILAGLLWDGVGPRMPRSGSGRGALRLRSCCWVSSTGDRARAHRKLTGSARPGPDNPSDRPLPLVRPVAIVRV